MLAVAGDTFIELFIEESSISSLEDRGYIELDEGRLEFFVQTMQYFSEEVFTLIVFGEKLFFRCGFDEEDSSIGNKTSFILAGDDIIPWRYPKKEKSKK